LTALCYLHGYGDAEIIDDDLTGADFTEPLIPSSSGPSVPAPPATPRSATYPELGCEPSSKTSRAALCWR